MEFEFLCLTRREKHLSAQVTFQHLLLGVEVHVPLQLVRGGFLLPAVGTLVVLDALVAHHVHLQLVRGAVPLVADFAPEL